jgi:hypothetical protein
MFNNILSRVIILISFSLMLQICVDVVRFVLCQIWRMHKNLKGAHDISSQFEVNADHLNRNFHT